MEPVVRCSTISIRSRRWRVDRRSGPQSSRTKRINLGQHLEQAWCEAATAVGETEIGEQARHLCGLFRDARPNFSRSNELCSGITKACF